MEIHVMRQADLGLALDMAAAEGWNPGKYDAEAFYAADPEGFFFGVQDGEPVATHACVRYGESYGFLGMYIVKPSHRGHGLGLPFWLETLRRLDGRNVGLDGVCAQEHNYTKYGFRTYYSHVRYEGEPVRAVRDEAGIVDVATVAFDELARSDRRWFGAPREAFLRKWIAQPEGVAVALVDTLRGYAVARACRLGYKVGPLFAQDERDADALFRAACRRVGDGPVFLDIPDVNPRARALVERYSMQPVFDTARMYNHGPHQIPLDEIYGVTSLELG